MPEELDLPDSLFIPSEEMLQEEVPGDVPTEEVAAPSEPENKAPSHISYARFQEVVHERNQERAENAQLRAMTMQMFGQNEQRNKPQAPPEPEIDQDVEALIAPIVEKRLAALMPTLHQVQNLQAQHETQEAWISLNRMVPDLDALGPDIVAHIQGMSKHRAAKVLSDPEDLAEIAELVRMRRSQRNVTATDTANRDMRNRAQGETPGGTRQASTTKDPFAELMSDDAKFESYMRKSGLL